MLTPHSLESSAKQASDLMKTFRFHVRQSEESLTIIMPVPQDPIAFTDTMADLLRLPDETLAMSYIYLNRYKRFQTTSASLDPLDEYVCIPSKMRDTALYALIIHPRLLTKAPLSQDAGTSMPISSRQVNRIPTEDARDLISCTSFASPI